MVSKVKHRAVFACVMAAITVSLTTGMNTFVNFGTEADFYSKWAHNFERGYFVVALCIFTLSPLLQKGLKRLIR